MSEVHKIEFMFSVYFEGDLEQCAKPMNDLVKKIEDAVQGTVNTYTGYANIQTGKYTSSLYDSLKVRKETAPLSE